MSVRKNKLRFIAFFAVAAMCGYGIYAAISAQGQGRLAQAPMNTQTTTQPAFIMAVDDSNSMGFETLTAIGDLNLRWNNCSASFSRALAFSFLVPVTARPIRVVCFICSLIMDLMLPMAAPQFLRSISSGLRALPSITKEPLKTPAICHH
ncbi:hypothetical protein ACFQS6_23115 [Xanthomonas populi]